MKKRYLILIIVFVFLCVIEVIRNTSAVHLDDVHPDIQCDEELLSNSDIFYVIPKFHNVSIADNLEWCSKILAYNKTLAMHGVYHTYREFNLDRIDTYIQEGEEAFEQCFGFSPSRFKAPQVSLSYSNALVLEEKGYTLDTLFRELFHKVYHCNDQGFYPNWVSDLI